MVQGIVPLRALVVVHVMRRRPEIAYALGLIFRNRALARIPMQVPEHGRNGFATTSHQPAFMISQAVPLLFSVAHLPAVAARMAVLAEPPISGTTFAVADTTVCACFVFTSMV